MQRSSNQSVVKYRCRGDFILYRVVNKGRYGSVVMPDVAEQGKERVVVAMGPEVEGLSIGDVILTTGEPNVDLVQLAEDPSLWLTRQANAVLVVLPPEHAEKG